MARKKTTAKKKKGLPKTKKFGDKNYMKKGCSKTKGGAKKLAEAARKRGQNARVVKNPAGGHCVYVRGRAKKKAA